MKLINKILVAPQAFKGSISAMDVCLAMADGVRNVFQDCEIIMCPVADGGDGTLETLVEISNGKVAGFIFVINLFDLDGCNKLKKKNYKISSLIEFPGH